MILRFCNHAIMQSYNLEQNINICNHLLIRTKPNPKLRKYLYKNTKEIPKLVLFRRSHVRWSCNPAIRSDALHHKSSASSQSSATIQQTWTTKWRKHTYKQAKEIPKLVLFRRSHVRRSCNPAIRSGALHQTHRRTFTHAFLGTRPGDREHNSPSGKKDTGCNRFTCRPTLIVQNL